MIIQFLSFPNIPIKKAILKGSEKRQQILQYLSDQQHPVTDKTMLIVDRSNHFMRIAADDPVSRYYGARPGDIFRVRDPSSLKYRQVVKIPMPEVKQPKTASEADWDIYFKAHNTMLSMLNDRQAPHKKTDLTQYRMDGTTMSSIISQAAYQQLDINGIVDQSSRYVYVRFLDKSHNTLSAPQLKKQLDMTYDSVVSFHTANEQVPADKRKEKDISVILITNNTKGLALPDISENAQVFSVQQLAFNVMEHCDQPEFTLLTADSDIDELREIYAQNGPVLSDDEETLESLGIKDGTKIIVL